MVNTGHEIVEHLVRQAKTGDREAFSRLVRLLMIDVLTLTFRMAQDRETAHDLTREKFVSARQNLHGFQKEAIFETRAATTLTVPGESLR